MGPKLPCSQRRPKAERTQHIPGYTSTSDTANSKSTCPSCQAQLLRASCLTAPGLDWGQAAVGRQSMGGCRVEQLCIGSLHPHAAGNHSAHEYLLDLRERCSAELKVWLCLVLFIQTHTFITRLPGMDVAVTHGTALLHVTRMDQTLVSPALLPILESTQT